MAADLTKLPYADWLEKAIQDLVKTDVASICIIVRTKPGDIYTDYYECSTADKILYGGFLNQDAMLDTLRVNGLIEDDEENQEDDEEDG